MGIPCPAAPDLPSASQALVWRVLRGTLFVLAAVVAATALAALLSHASASASESHPTPGGHPSSGHPSSGHPAKVPGTTKASGTTTSLGAHAATTHPGSTHTPATPRPATHAAPAASGHALSTQTSPAGPFRATPPGRGRAPQGRTPAGRVWPTPPGHVWGANPPTWPPRPVVPVAPVHPVAHPVVPAPVRHLPPFRPLPPVQHRLPVWHLPIGWPVHQPVTWPWGPGRFDHGPVIRHEPTRTTTKTAPQTARTGTAAPVQAVSRVAAHGVRPASYPPPDPGAPPRRVPGKPVYEQMVPRNAILAAARRIEHGHAPGWHRGHHVPYAWDAGHGRRPGPTYGSAGGEGSSIDAHTYGVDCSGFARWVYALAYHHDVLHRGNTNDQIAEMHRDPHRHPGDLVFFGDSRSDTVHVGVYIGHGQMIDAPETGENVQTQPVSAGGHIVGFYRGPTVRVRVRSTTPTT